MERTLPPESEIYGLRRTATIILHIAEACARCGDPIDGWVFIDAHLALVDTEGFSCFKDGPICDECLGRDARGHPKGDH